MDKTQIFKLLNSFYEYYQENKNNSAKKSAEKTAQSGGFNNADTVNNSEKTASTNGETPFSATSFLGEKLGSLKNFLPSLSGLFSPKPPLNDNGANINNNLAKQQPACQQSFAQRRASEAPLQNSMISVMDNHSKFVKRVQNVTQPQIVKPPKD